MTDKARLNAAGYFRGLRDLMAGVTSTTGEIDEETGLFVGWDEPPFTVKQEILYLNTKPCDGTLDAGLRGES